MRVFSLQKKADVLGISSSMLCIIHCLLFPALILAGNFSDYWHRWEVLDYFFILFAALAVYASTRRLKSGFIRSGLWWSLLCFSASVLLHEHYSSALFVSLTASLSLVFFHMASYREKHP